VTIGTNLRPALAAGALSLALALAPATAQAKKADSAATNGGAPGVYVCNEAGMAFVDGTLDVIDPAADPNPPARHKKDLYALPGQGNGLVNAASHSPALALCGEPTPPTSPSEGDWGDAGDPGTGDGGTGDYGSV
jgi:hypothetical protein